MCNDIRAKKISEAYNIDVIGIDKKKLIYNLPGYTHIIGLSGLSKAKLDNPNTMTDTSYLKYLNNTKFSNSPLEAVSIEGNQLALNYMEQYNKRDVEILESVYLKLRPFIKGHPNISNLTEKECCCSCGSEAVEPIPNKFYYTSVSKFQLYRCKNCGAVVRGRKNLAEKVKFVSPCR